MNRTVTCTIGVALLTATVWVSAAPTGDLSAVNALYTSADYQGALTVLDRIGATDDRDIVEVERYRALCYVALGQTDEATRAVERLISARPEYRIGGDQVSPRFETLFTRVRRQVLPDVVNRRFVVAKETYLRGDVAGAAAHFRDVRGLLDDPELAELGDLRTIVNGYLDLTDERLRAATAPSPAARTDRAIVPTPAASTREIYTAASRSVVPPEVISQTLPPFTYPLKEPLHGVLFVIIGEDGRVVDADMRVPTNTPYDAVAVAAARKWRFRPAAVNGKPVRFEKAVNVNVAVRQTR
jgi:hypothetical protein